MLKNFLLLVCLCSITFCNTQTLTIRTDLTYKVNLPLKKTEKPPVIVLLHGYGSNEEDLFDIAKSFDERFVTVSLRAPFNAKDQGYCWYPLDLTVNKEFRHDYKMAKESRTKILAFISSFCKEYKADSTQVFLLGFSQGAIMSYDLAFFKPEKIKGVVALSGLLLEETKKIKTDALKLAKVKFFIAHGNADNVIDLKKGEEAAKFLKDKKNNVTFKTYEMPHALVGKELNDIKDWLKSNIEKEKK